MRQLFIYIFNAHKPLFQDGVLIENMHDVPYVQPKNMEPETVAVMSAICSEVRRIVSSSKPCGVQV